MSQYSGLVKRQPSEGSSWGAVKLPMAWLTCPHMQFTAWVGALSISSLCAGCGAQLRCCVRITGHANASECLPQGRGPLAAAAPPARTSAAARSACPFHPVPQGAPALHNIPQTPVNPIRHISMVLRSACALSVQLVRCQQLERGHAWPTPDDASI